MINIKLNKDKLIPTKKTFIDISFITLSSLLVRFILDSLGIYHNVEGLPLLIRMLIIVGSAVYLRSIIDFKIFGRDWI